MSLPAVARVCDIVASSLLSQHVAECQTTPRSAVPTDDQSDEIPFEGQTISVARTSFRTLEPVAGRSRRGLRDRTDTDGVSGRRSVRGDEAVDDFASEGLVDVDVAGYVGEQQRADELCGDVVGVEATRESLLVDASLDEVFQDLPTAPLASSLRLRTARVRAA